MNSTSTFAHFKNIKNLKHVCMFSKIHGGISDYQNLKGFMEMLDVKRKNKIQQGGSFNESNNGFTMPYYLNNQIVDTEQMVPPEQMEFLNNEQAQVQELQKSNVHPLPYPMPSNQISTFTIPAGTILYHATTNRKGFNTQYMELGNDKLILFFTPNFRLASDKIEGCSLDKQNGFIHVFRVTRDIPDIYIKLPYDMTDDTDMSMLENNFCSGTNKFSGVGFFYPKSNIEMFSKPEMEPSFDSQNDQNQYQYQYQNYNDQNQIPFNSDNYYSEFGLCNPRAYLEYIYSQKCQSLKKLSNPYRFDV